MLVHTIHVPATFSFDVEGCKDEESALQVAQIELCTRRKSDIYGTDPHDFKGGWMEIDAGDIRNAQVVDNFEGATVVTFDYAICTQRGAGAPQGYIAIDRFEDGEVAERVADIYGTGAASLAAADAMMKILRGET